MSINTLSKNSMGVVLALLLTILLSESRLFNLLTDTYLGRAFLIIIILFASYLNKILGVACVLIIVIIFTKNSYSYTFYEGIDGTVTNNIDDKDKKSSVTKNENGATSESSGTTTTAANVPNDKINIVTSSSSNKKNDSTTTTTTTSPSIEGFDLQGTENTILRGKQSNTIPVNQYYNQSVEVAPYENSSFSKFFEFLHTMI